MLYPMILNPVLKEYLWGGTNLKDKYGKQTEKETIAESWELSCHPEGISTIANGVCKGMELTDYIIKNGHAVLGSNVDQAGLPVLIKLIDAADNLSIQVHPGDSYAKQTENQSGKKEMWYITECEPTSYLYYGISRKISKDEFIKKAKDGTITDIINRVPVRQGDVFFIDSGVVHAIGKGLTVAEIGSNCNITYRIFDFFRKDKSGMPRELHISNAADVACLDTPVAYKFDEYGVLDCKDFIVEEIKLKGLKNLKADNKSFHSLLCIQGSCIIQYNGEEVLAQKGTSVFIPAGMGNYALKGNAVLLKTTV